MLFHGLPLQNKPYVTIYPGDTAIHRHDGGSPAGRKVAPLLAALQERKGEPLTVLDWGAGYGRDIGLLRSQGIACDGVDPMFGVHHAPLASYDFILCIAVLNTIPIPLDRLRSLRAMVAYARTGTTVMLVTRKTEDILEEAQDAMSDPDDPCEPYGDGYLFRFPTDRREETTVFQRGFQNEEVDELARNVGLRRLKGKSLESFFPENVSGGFYGL